MSAAQSKADVIVSAEELSSVRHEVEKRPGDIAGFAVIMANGETRELPPGLSKIIAQTLESLAANGSATIGILTDELTSNTAAEVLGISRPTLLKMAKAGDIASFRIGSHTRFKRADVLELKARRESERNKAMMELLEIREGLEVHK